MEIKKYLLKLIRLFNKTLNASQWARIKTEKLFKDKRIYNYLVVPDVCFNNEVALK